MTREKRNHMNDINNLDQQKFKIIKKHILEPLAEKEKITPWHTKPEDPNRTEIEKIDTYEQLWSLFAEIYVDQDLKRVIKFAEQNRLKDDKYKNNNIAVWHIKKLLESDEITKNLNSDDMIKLQAATDRDALKYLHDSHPEQKKLYHVIRNGLIKALWSPEYQKLIIAKSSDQGIDNWEDPEDYINRMRRKVGSKEEISKREEAYLWLKQVFDSKEFVIYDTTKKQEVHVLDFDNNRQPVMYNPVLENWEQPSAPKNRIIQDYNSSFSAYLKTAVNPGYLNGRTPIPESKRPWIWIEKRIWTLASIKANNSRTIANQDLKDFIRDVCFEFDLYNDNETKKII